VGSDTYVNCGDATTTQVVPQPVIDAIDLVLNTVIDGLNTVNDLLNQLVFEPTDSVTCAVLLTIRDAVNGLGHPEIIHIDTDGDLHAGGALLAALGADTTDPAYDLVWDCPPYRTTP
jgi:hypothetical protein